MMNKEQLRKVLAHLAKNVDTATIYDAIATVYDDLYETETDLKENSQIRDALRHVRGRKILDVGCGIGLLLRLLNVAPENYLGIDISRGMVEKARLSFPHHIFLQDDLMHLSKIKLDSVENAVSLLGPYNYIKSPKELATAIRNLYLRLKKNGKIFIMLLSTQHPAKGGGHIIWPKGDDVLRTFNKRQAEVLFQPYFKKVKVEYFPPASKKHYLTVTGVKK